jgi:hypothetical protein
MQLAGRAYCLTIVHGSCWAPAHRLRDVVGVSRPVFVLCLACTLLLTLLLTGAKVHAGDHRCSWTQLQPWP